MFKRGFSVNFCSVQVKCSQALRSARIKHVRYKWKGTVGHATKTWKARW